MLALMFQTPYEPTGGTVMAKQEAISPAILDVFQG